MLLASITLIVDEQNMVQEYTAALLCCARCNALHCAATTTLHFTALHY